MYKLLGKDLKFYESEEPGKLGGYWRGSNKIYGKLDCKSALRWLKAGHYKDYRVFFADEQAAIQAGFRPCKICMKGNKMATEYFLLLQPTAKIDEIKKALEKNNIEVLETSTGKVKVKIPVEDDLAQLDQLDGVINVLPI